MTGARVGAGSSRELKKLLLAAVNDRESWSKEEVEEGEVGEES